MSGALPPWSFAKDWRQASHTHDKLNATAPLTGGWHTDGGHLKSSLTIASSASLMAFAALTWEQDLRTAPNGEPNDAAWNQLLRNLDWAADYLHQCASVGGNGTFVAQVGDHFTEDSYWGPPEDAPADGFRPVWVIDAKNKEGADVTSQAVAALTAVGLLLQKDGTMRDPVRSKRYLDKAAEVWSWAKNLQSVWQAPEGNNTVISRTVADDKAWAAAWVCKREIMIDGPNVDAACSEAAEAWDDYHMREGHLNTDNWHAAALLLLRDVSAGGSTAMSGYLAALQARYLNKWVPSSFDESSKPACDPCTPPAGGMCEAPGGFVVVEGPAPAYYTAAMAFVALAAAEPEGSVDPNLSRRWQCWAKSQVDWMLGNNPSGKAIVTGLENTPGFSAIAIPTQPRHRGSACADGVCAEPGRPNPRTLPGALLAGPQRDGTIEDNRDNGPYSFVSIEYNGAFAAALMGLSSLRREWTQSGKTWGAFCTAPPTPYIDNKFCRGQSLNSSSYANRIASPNGIYSLLLNTNGALEFRQGQLLRWGYRPLTIQSQCPCTFSFESSGVLAVKDRNNVAQWHYWPLAGTNPQCLELTDDGQMRLLGANSEVVETILPKNRLCRGDVLTSSTDSPANFTSPKDRLCLELTDDGQMRLLGANSEVVETILPKNRLCRGDVLTSSTDSPANFTSPKDRLVAAPYSNRWMMILNTAGNFILYNYAEGSVPENSPWSTGSAYPVTATALANAPYTLGFREPDGALVIRDKNDLATDAAIAALTKATITESSCLELTDDGQMRLLGANSEVVETILPKNRLCRGDPGPNYICAPHALSIRPVGCQEFPGFTLYPDTDIIGYDIASVNTSAMDLAALCRADNACKSASAVPAASIAGSTFPQSPIAGPTASAVPAASIAGSTFPQSPIAGPTASVPAASIAGSTFSQSPIAAATSHRFFGSDGWMKINTSSIHPLTGACFYERPRADPIVDNNLIIIGTGTWFGSCVEVPNNNQAAGVFLQQGQCNGASSQTFVLDAAGPGGWYRILSTDGLCWGVKDASTADAAQLVLGPCSGADEQRFRFEAHPRDGYRIMPKHTLGMCVDVLMNYVDNGQRLQIWPCNLTPAQQFEVISSPVPRAESECPDAPGFVMQEDMAAWGGTPFRRTFNLPEAAEACTVTPFCKAFQSDGWLRKDWEIVTPTPGSCLYTRPTADVLVHNNYVIIGTASWWGGCVDGGLMTAGNILRQVTCNGNPSQHWILENEGDGWWRIRSVTGMCWGVINERTDSGAEMVLKPCRYAAQDQQFRVTSHPRGGVYFTPRHAQGMRVDVLRAESSDAKTIQIWPANVFEAQQFDIITSVKPRPPPAALPPPPPSSCPQFEGFVARDNLDASGTDIRTLASFAAAAQACSFTPYCKAFLSTGQLKTSISSTFARNGTCLYTRPAMTEITDNAYVLIGTGTWFGGCIDGGSLTAGESLRQYTCNGTMSQHWLLEDVSAGGGWWRIRAPGNLSLCWGVRDPTNWLWYQNTQFSWMELKVCNASAWDQIYRIYAHPYGGYYFQPRHQLGYRVDVRDGNQGDGRLLQIWPTNLTPAQMFDITLSPLPRPPYPAPASPRPPTSPPPPPRPPIACPLVQGFTVQDATGVSGGIDIRNAGSAAAAAEACAYTPYCKHFLSSGELKVNVSSTFPAANSCLYTRPKSDGLVHNSIVSVGTATSFGSCVHGGVTENTVLGQLPCSGSPNQAFYLASRGDHWTVRSLNGLCWSIFGGTPGTQAILATCNGADVQLFNFTAAVGGGYNIRPKHAPSYCLTTEAVSGAVRVGIALCNQLPAQQFEVAMSAAPSPPLPPSPRPPSPRPPSPQPPTPRPQTVCSALAGFTSRADVTAFSGYHVRQAGSLSEAVQICSYNPWCRFVNSTSLILRSVTAGPMDGACLYTRNASVNDLVHGNKVTIGTSTGNSGSCWDLRNYYWDNNEIIQYACNQEAHQRLFTESAGNGWWKLRTDTNLLCVGMRNRNNTRGTYVVLKTCTNEDDEFFNITAVPGGGYNLQPKNAPGMCVNVQDDSPDNDRPLVISECAGTQAQIHQPLSQPLAPTVCAPVAGFTTSVDVSAYGGVDIQDPGSVQDAARVCGYMPWCKYITNWGLIKRNAAFTGYGPVTCLYTKNTTGDQLAHGKMYIWGTSTGDSGRCFDTRSSFTPDTEISQHVCVNSANHELFLEDAGSGWWKLRTLNGLCLGLRNGGTAAGTRLALKTCNRADDEYFNFTAVADAYTLRPRHAPNMCVDVENASQDNGRWIQLGQCNGTQSQLIKPLEKAYPATSLVDRAQVMMGTSLGNSGSCWDQGAISVNSEVYQWPCDNVPNHKFYLERAAGGLWKLRTSTGLCFGFRDAGTARQTRMILKDCANADDQLFNFTAVAGGGYTIRPKHAPAMCVDVENADAGNGRRIQLWECAGTQAQLFQALVTVQAAPTVCPAVAGFNTSLDTMVMAGGRDVTNAGSVASAAQACAYLPWCTYVSNAGVIKRDGDLIYGPATCLYTRNPASELVDRGRVTFGTSLGSSTSCWDVINANFVADNEVQQWPCSSNNDAQRFFLEAASGGWWKLRTTNGLCFGFRNAGTARQTRMVLKQCANDNDQFFNITAAVGGGYTMRPRHAPGMCVDVENADAGNGRRIQLWDCAGTQAQLFQALVATVPPATCPSVAGFTAAVDTMTVGGTAIRSSGSVASAAQACAFLPWCNYVSNAGVVSRGGAPIYGPVTCLYSRNSSVNALVDRAQVMMGTSLGNSGSCWDQGAISVNSEVYQWSCDNVPNHRFYLESTAGGWWKLRSSTGLCFGFRDAGTARQTRMILKTCANADDQLFNFTAVAGGGYTVRPKHAPGMCVDVENADASNGRRIQLWDCAGTEAQLFQALLVPVSAPTELFNAGQIVIGTSLGSGSSCFDATGNALDSWVVQYGCHGLTNQRFYLESAAGGWWKLRSSTGLCFGFQNAGTANGTRMILKTCATADDQLFNFTAVAGGGYTIQPKHAPGMCAAVEGADGSNNRQIQLWRCDGSQSQLFQAVVTVPAPTVCATLAGFTALADTMAVGGLDISNQGSISNAASYCSYMPWCTYVTATGLVKRSADTMYGPTTCLYSKNADRSVLVNAGQYQFGTALGSFTGCFDVGSNALNSEVVQWTCHGGTNQRYNLESTAGGWWKVRSTNGFCLGFQNAGTVNGTRVLLKTCATADDQLFNFTAVAGGGYTIQPKHAPGMCVDVENADGNNGRRIQLWQCAGTQAQLFQALLR
ncbi:hypothetical protein GPECTOR_105g112 [Gonium pectorale]|uniref:cellulase n=1 Tax=Gonium pectorale TaxID=33097 RepID=A0A150FZQ4_GONPE|nr:hypothetical protein GPECTOR_105g112 [Gonium pectorale]|eukprot:KXZ43058.1 hypothetical protein GPECTOR_105g112 [Gonium pectorale]